MRRMTSSITARGVGPKLGRSIVHKFAHERYTVAILSRDLGRLSRFVDEIAREEKAYVFVIRIDCPDSKSIMEAFEGVLSLEFVEVLVYNAYYQPVSWNPTSFTDIKTNSLKQSFAISFLDAFLCTQQVPVQLSFQPSRNKYPFTLSTFLSYGIESMEGAFWDSEKAKRNDSFHWLISFAL
ncbi:hypothetical protein V6N13_040145 [Hibiscus sabdariffa]|uniref:Uncharacterized protein n=1 Tax=Hibiscus sabdariffa TaxID=183260 RepID=A0ABR2STC5_9ROSI